MFLCTPICSAVSGCLTDSCALQFSILLLLLWAEDNLFKSSTKCTKNVTDTFHTVVFLELKQGLGGQVLKLPAPVLALQI